LFTQRQLRSLGHLVLDLPSRPSRPSGLGTLTSHLPRSVSPLYLLAVLAYLLEQVKNARKCPHRQTHQSKIQPTYKPIAPALWHHDRTDAQTSGAGRVSDDRSGDEQIPMIRSHCRRYKQENACLDIRSRLTNRHGRVLDIFSFPFLFLGHVVSDSRTPTARTG
jgi:hypothetical protein